MMYWHNRLIESFKRIGIQEHNVNMASNVVGVFSNNYFPDFLTLNFFFKKNNNN